MASSAQTTQESTPVPLEGVTVESRRGSDSWETDSVQEYLEERRHAEEESSRQRDTLKRLRSWHNWDQGRRTSLTRFCLSTLRLSKRPECPNDDDLMSLATYYFPLRKDLKVIVCDFGAGRFERSEHSLTAVEDDLRSKPEWATVRWVHVPLGPGPLASTLRDIFLRSAPEVSRPEQPHLQREVLSLRNFQHLQDQIDVIKISTSLSQLNIKLDISNRGRLFKGHSQTKLPAVSPSLAASKSPFWEDVASDLPSLLTEGDYGEPHVSTVPQLPKINDQMLSQHPAYKQVILVRNTFQSFDRKDGYLLTMSPMSGFSYLDSMILSRPIDPVLFSIYRGGIHEALEWLRQRWSPGYGSSSRIGTDSWEDQSVEWLRTSILMELEGTPGKRDSQQMYTPDVPTAYTWIVRNLRRRQTLPLKRYESVELVREYANCMNEISCIHAMSAQRLGLLEDLRQKWGDEARLGNDRPRTGRMIGTRIEKVRADHEHLPQLLNELKGSLDVLFQIRTMEQNELTLMAESNNRAILVFTIVTIIFLPLSFFTSYFGMNLKGIADSDKTERYFWAICGSVTTFVVVLTILFGFKERLRSWILDRIS